MRFLLFLLLSLCAFASPHPVEIDRELKEQMSPHLLPSDHPIKPIVDLIFSQSRVTSSRNAMIDAGFSIHVSMPRSEIVVARHPLVPGYVFKMHLDTQEDGRYGVTPMEWLVHRCENAKKIKKIIQKNHIEHFMVPDKWLYILPAFPLSNKKYPQPAILIAQDMNICSRGESEIAWKTVATKQHLKELYTILKQGVGSPSLCANIPYVKDGVFAFIDTEKPVSTRRLKKIQTKRYLSEPMQKYWKKLIQ